VCGGKEAGPGLNGTEQMAEPEWRDLWHLRCTELNADIEINISYLIAVN
jgi:hypothetical protein